MNTLAYYLRCHRPVDKPLSYCNNLPDNRIHSMTYYYGDNFKLCIYISNNYLYGELYNNQNILRSRCIFDR